MERMMNTCDKHFQFMEIDYSKNPPEFICKECEKEKQNEK